MREIFKLAGVVAVEGLSWTKKGLQEIDSQFKQAEKSLAKFGRQAERAGTNLTKTLTLPLVAVGAAIGVSAGKFGAYADNLLDLVDITGMSTDTLQEMENVARTAGVEFEGFTNVVSKFSNSLPEIEKGSGPAYEAIKKLGVNIHDASGRVRDMNVLFPEMLAALRGIENITERNAMAQDIFGRSLKDIAPVLGMTTEQFEAARKEAHDLGLVMSNESIQAADAYRKEVEKLSAQFTVLWRGLALDFIPLLRDTFFPIIQNTVIPAIQRLSERVRAGVTWFNGLSEGAKKTAIFIGAFALAVGPAILLVGKFASAVVMTTKAIALARTAMIGLSLAMATNPILLAVAAIGLLTAAIWGAKVAKDALNSSFEKEIITADTVATEINMRAVEARRKALMALRLELVSQKKSTKDVDMALSELAEAERKVKLSTLDRITEEGAGFKTLTEKEKEAARERAEKRAAYEKQWTEALLRETQSQLAILDYEEKEALSRKENTEASRTTIVATYASRREKIYADEADKQRALIDHMNEQLDESERIKQEDARNLATYAAEWSIATRRDAIQVELAAELNKARKIRATEQTIFNIKKYYADQEKQLARDTAASWISDIGGMVGQVMGLFSGISENESIAIDNNYKKRKAAIENIAMGEKERATALENLDKEFDKKRSALRRKQAKQEKVDALFSIAINTAVAVVKALPNLFLSIAVGIIGAAQAAVVAARPLPMLEGGLLKSRPGRGTITRMAEGNEDEVALPLDTGVRAIVDRLIDQIATIRMPAFAGSYAMAGGGSQAIEHHWHIGTLVADERGLKELERRMAPLRLQEAQRRGDAV